MKKKLAFLPLLLLFLFSCSSKPSSMVEHIDSIHLDSVARATAQADTSGFVGSWHTKYGYYAYNVIVTLNITKGSGSCPGYLCRWEAHDEMGLNCPEIQGTYSWCATYGNNTLMAVTNFQLDNTRVTMYRNDDPGSIHVSIQYPNRDNPWELTFTR